MKKNKIYPKKIHLIRNFGRLQTLTRCNTDIYNNKKFKIFKEITT